MSDSEPPRRLDRFRALEDATGTPLDPGNAPVAQELQPGELPFRRCAKCQMDAHRSARRCEMCGADLRTTEQDEFQAGLAAERRSQTAQLRAQTDELAVRQAAAIAEQQGVSRFSRVGVEEEDAEVPAPRPPPPPGLGLAAKIPEGAYIVVLVTLVTLISALGLAHQLSARKLVVLVLLALPAALGILVARTWGPVEPR